MLGVWCLLLGVGCWVLGVWCWALDRGGFCRTAELLVGFLFGLRLFGGRADNSQLAECHGCYEAAM